MAYVHQNSTTDAIDPTTLPDPPLLHQYGIKSRFVDTSPWSLVFHILECIPENPDREETKLILLVHGFPDVAYAWRKVLPEIAAQGYHAVAYDIRGSGRTFSRTPVTTESFRPINLVRDALALVSALGYESVSTIVGHDFGAVTATLCSLARPDIFKSVLIMSHPVKGPSSLPFRTQPSYGNPMIPETSSSKTLDVHKALAELAVPRKHYQRYYCSAGANDEMTLPAGQELNDFLRGYFHLKSADWDGNRPRRLHSYTAAELAQMPGYYIMPKQLNMRETVARDMESQDLKTVIRQAHGWLNETELTYYAEEWTRTSFLGGLNWYRLTSEPDLVTDFCVWHGYKLNVPTTFMSGDRDWGSFQDPGALEALENGNFVANKMYRDTVIVGGAGHWVNQEQPSACTEQILRLAGEIDGAQQ